MTRVESAAMSDDLLSRFLRYVRVDTQSDETSNTFPSTPGQLVLLEMLKHELSELGASDVEMTKDGYVMASIPANTRKARVPTVAFFAHVDTAPDCSGHNVKPILHRRYNGRVMKFPDNPHLNSRSGGVAGASIGARQFLPHAGRRRILDRFRASSS